MELSVIFFLFAVIVVLAAGLCLTAKAASDNADAAIEYSEENKALRAEKNELLLDKITLSEINEELETDNIRLSEAVRELREINKELTAEQPKKEQAREYLPPPDIPTNMMRCEPYDRFHPGSEQNKLQRLCETNRYGIRVYYDENGAPWCCAALAGAYGTEIGHCYRFTLENGNTIPVILADYKHPIDNVRSDDYGDIDENYDGEACISVIEFVVDMQAIPERVKNAGTMTALPDFGGLYGHGGNIVKVEDCGRRWEP